MDHTGGHSALNPEQVLRAAHSVSKRGALRFTARNVYYKMLREGTWREVPGDPEGSLQSFLQALAAFEAAHGRLPGRISAPAPLPEPETAGLHEDLTEYSVRRIIVVDRVELLLLFVLNGFHRKIEMGLALWPDFPRHIWHMHEDLPCEPPPRTFYVLHDCDEAGYSLAEKVRAFVAERGWPDRVVDLGMRFHQACNLGLPIRRRSGGGNGRGSAVPETVADRDEARLLFQAGGYAHLEELSPLQLLRWAYRRVARRHEDVGFG